MRANTFTFLLSACLVVAGCSNTEPDTKAGLISDESILQDIDQQVHNMERLSLTQRDTTYKVDNGSGVYKGFFDENNFVKFLHERKTDQGAQTGEYYFDKGQLIFVHITENKKKCKGEMTCAWELKHYYLNGHLFRSFKRGDVFAPGIPFELENRNFTPNIEDNLAAEDTIQQHFAGYVVSLLTSR